MMLKAYTAVNRKWENLTLNGGKTALLIGRGRPKAAGAAHNFSLTSTGNARLLSA